jgi:hypothetical protein
MSQEPLTNVEVHEGHPVGVKVLVEFEPEEARRLAQLAEESGLSLASYLKRLAEDAAATGAR